MLPYILCPTCSGDDLTREEYAWDGDIVLEGRLICKSCRTWYRIENSIVDLLPLSLRRTDLYEKFVQKYNLSFEKTNELKNKQKESQIDFFIKSSKSYEEQITNNPYFKALDKIVFHEWIKRTLRPGYWVLEIGCGTGRQCIPMAHNNVHTVGIDISEEMLLVAQRIIDSNALCHFIDLIVADAESLPVKDNSFDACVMVGTLHHVQNPGIVIFNASRKAVPNGAFFSYDPHKSPVRFIFDFLMKIWKLYDEKASDAPLITENQLKNWFQKAGIKGSIRISTFLPPYVFYLFTERMNTWLLRISDSIFGSIPVVKKLGGMIIAEGKKADKDTLD